jgi:hypothetical protein
MPLIAGQLDVHQDERRMSLVREAHTLFAGLPELLLRLCQALLQVAESGVVLGRLAGNRGLAFLGLPGLWTPAHAPPLASYESAGDRLGECAAIGKRVKARSRS